MILSFRINNPSFFLQSSAPTVIEPGDSYEIIVEIRAIQKMEITDFTWTPIPELISENNITQFPISLQANESRELKFKFRSEKKEGFGENHAMMQYTDGNLSAGSQSVNYSHWLSIFKKADVGAAPYLEDSLRHRLITVVNSRLVNGFLYMADFQKFFDDYLHIHIPDPLNSLIIKQLQLTHEPLPVDNETFYRIAAGELSYYGIEKFELIAEEECVESDDRFDPEDLKEVHNPQIDI